MKKQTQTKSQKELNSKAHYQQGFSKEAAKLMMKSKFGRIVNIGSICSTVEPIGASIYSATKAAADHFQYEIEHYGKILNANRSYYLTRTQPPFYSSLICEVFEVSYY